FATSNACAPSMLSKSTRWTEREPAGRPDREVARSANAAPTTATHITMVFRMRLLWLTLNDKPRIEFVPCHLCIGRSLLVSLSTQTTLHWREFPSRVRPDIRSQVSWPLL